MLHGVTGEHLGSAEGGETEGVDVHSRDGQAPAHDARAAAGGRCDLFVGAVGFGGEHGCFALGRSCAVVFRARHGQITGTGNGRFFAGIV